MAATLFLQEPLGDGERRIECEDVKVIGDIVWATPEGDGQETVVPLSNVSGISGDTVKQEVEALEAPGGRFTELVTDIC
jgi:hypothetical protein